MLLQLITKSICNLYNYQIMASIIVSSSKISDMNYIQLPSFIYQDVINLVVFPHQEKCKCIYKCCDVGTLYCWKCRLIKMHLNETYSKVCKG